MKNNLTKTYNFAHLWSIWREVRPSVEYLTPGSGAKFVFLCDCGIFVTKCKLSAVFLSVFERQSSPALSYWDREAPRNWTFLAGFLLWKRICSIFSEHFPSGNTLIWSSWRREAARILVWHFLAKTFLCGAFSERQFVTVVKNLAPRNGSKFGIYDLIIIFCFNI